MLGSRVGPSISRADSLPAFRCGRELLTWSNMTSIWPDNRSINAGPEPLYAMGVKRVPVAFSNWSMAR
ncbi:Uncharacterised protein [Bordetella pertussis]|nr:Uncharacterised protein [Bordetella pertussis]